MQNAKTSSFSPAFHHITNPFFSGPVVTDTFKWTLLDFSEKDVFDADLIRFSIYAALSEKQILVMNLAVMGPNISYVNLIDVKIGKQKIEFGYREDDLLREIRDPIIENILSCFDKEEMKGVQIIIKMRFFMDELGRICYHTRTKGRDVGSTHVTRGVLNLNYLKNGKNNIKPGDI